MTGAAGGLDFAGGDPAGDQRPGLIYQWLSGIRPLAAHHCPAIERATGVTCEDLRPDLHWLRDESGAVTGYQVPTRAA